MRLNFKPSFRFLVLILVPVICSIIFCSTCSACSSTPLNIFGARNLTAGYSKELVETVFPPNNINGWNPMECEDKKAASGLAGTGDFESIMKAKNADKYFFNGSGDVPSAAWSDTDTGSMKRLLETYGDLAYQLGRAVGAPWIAILTQMRYEDSQSVCGANNFWGNGCDPSHAYTGGATIQGKNLGEGFIQYGQTLTNGMHDQALGISDPKEYLEKIGPTWVQGSPDGPGYGSIDAMRSSVDALTAYIESSEGQSIIEGFTDYSGIDYGGSSSSSSSSTSEPPSGDQITWIGDSYSVAAHSIIEEKLPGISFGSGIENSGSYIQSNKGVSDRYGGGDANPPALTILKRLADSGELKPYLVMAVGTNMGWDDNEVNTFNSIMSSHPDTKVVFVTAKAKARLSAETDGTNERLKALADSNDNYYLADWAAAYDDSYFANNSTHPDTNGGYEKWVEVIVNALNQLGGDCVEGNSDVLSSVESIIELANKNGSTYTWGGGHTSDSGTFDAMLNGSPINVDCTGFASLVMYKTYGEMTSFTSYSIFNDPLYKEIDRADVQPGDIFAYNSPSGHGGIVIEASNGVVTKIAETGGSEGASGSNNNIGYSGPDSFSVQNMNGENGHFFRWNGPNNGSKGTSNTCNYCDGGEDSTHSGGFNDVAEADRVVMDPYRDMAANHPEEWGTYHITAGTPYNCFSFSNYFISKYTSIDFYGVPGVDGGGYAEEFYNLYHGDYPEITLSDKPTPYSVAGCGDSSFSGNNYSHTFIVLGVDTSADTMIYGEASYGAGPGGIVANQISLSDPSWGSRNGSTGICHYADFSKYIKGL